jgi:hypothetical protein
MKIFMIGFDENLDDVGMIKYNLFREEETTPDDETEYGRVLAWKSKDKCADFIRTLDSRIFDWIIVETEMIEQEIPNWIKVIL